VASCVPACELLLCSSFLVLVEKKERKKERNPIIRGAYASIMMMLKD